MPVCQRVHAVCRWCREPQPQTVPVDADWQDRHPVCGVCYWRLCMGVVRQHTPPERPIGDGQPA